MACVCGRRRDPRLRHRARNKKALRAGFSLAGEGGGVGILFGFIFDCVALRGGVTLHHTEMRKHTHAHTNVCERALRVL